MYKSKVVNSFKDQKGNKVVTGELVTLINNGVSYLVTAINKEGNKTVVWLRDTVTGKEFHSYGKLLVSEE